MYKSLAIQGPMEARCHSHILQFVTYVHATLKLSTQSIKLPSTVLALPSVRPCQAWKACLALWVSWLETMDQLINEHQNITLVVFIPMHSFIRARSRQKWVVSQWPSSWTRSTTWSSGTSWSSWATVQVSRVSLSYNYWATNLNCSFSFGKTRWKISFANDIRAGNNRCMLDLCCNDRTLLWLHIANRRFGL